MTRRDFGGRMVMVLVGLAAGVPRSAAGQGRIPQILTLGGGMSRYDISNEKASTFVFHLRFDGYFGPYVIFEPGAAYMRIKTTLGSRNYLLPELSLQVQGYVGGEKIRPFIGGGIGFANIATGANENQFTVHAVTGVRIHVGGPWGIRLEARARSIDPWHGHTLDFTAGIMRVMPTGM